MSEEKESQSSLVGIIPDFFHDIIAYIIPGYTALILFVCNLYIVGLLSFDRLKDFTGVSLGGFSLSGVAAYVIGRFFEQLGIWTMNRTWLRCIYCREWPSPKWSLIFGQEEPAKSKYTQAFKDGVKKRLRERLSEWLGKDLGESLLSECEDKKKTKDDYFNLIQYHLRESLPSVALYEKKQNATIAMTRSLTLVFFSNILIYFLSLPVAAHQDGVKLDWSWPAVYWLVSNALFCWSLYTRFRKDYSYHAEYIFENFIVHRQDPDNDKPRQD